MTEVSLVDVYSANRSKLGEVLQSTVEETIVRGFLLARLPGSFFSSINGSSLPSPINGYLPIHTSVEAQVPGVINW